MPFPKTDRVIYKINTLDSVICQIRFPSILEIDAEIPAEFQKKIRNNYPNYSQKSNVVIPEEILRNSNVPKEVLEKAITSSNHKVYEFSSVDNDLTVGLTSSFISLTSRKYIRWEEFKSSLELAFSALNDIYSPAFVSRLGLRYINVIKRSKLGCSNSSWNKLLQPAFIGALNSDDRISEKIVNLQNLSEIKLSDETSLVRVTSQLVADTGDDEQCFMIDSDFHTTNRIEIGETFEKLKYFNKRAARLIRWSFQDELHDAMQPEAIEE